MGKELGTMVQVKETPEQSLQAEHETQKLGPFLCWAVVSGNVIHRMYFFHVGKFVSVSVKNAQGDKEIEG